MSYFFRRTYHFAKREWDESQHPRGKTTEGTNTGSFAPNPKGADPGAKATDLSGGFRRPYRAAVHDPAADAHVANSSTPAQAMRDQWGPFLSKEQVLEYLQTRVTPEQWAEYEAASRAANAAQEAAGGDTQTQYARMSQDPNNPKDGVPYYDDQRKALVHGPVIEDYVERYIAAAQANGDNEAELVVLAGRGGSGKSSFGYSQGATGETNQFYFGFFPKGSIVLDPDNIKRELYEAAVKSGLYPKDAEFNPGASGAGYWHEESSYVTKVIQQKLENLAKIGYRANTVFDLTLASNKGDLMGKFKDLGFTTTLANMNIPMEESAYQAVNRFLTKKLNSDGVMVNGRLVPVDIIAGSSKNERNFDTMIRMTTHSGQQAVDRWYIYTMAASGPPHMVARGGAKRSGGRP